MSLAVVVGESRFFKPLNIVEIAVVVEAVDSDYGAVALVCYVVYG